MAGYLIADTMRPSYKRTCWCGAGCVYQDTKDATPTEPCWGFVRVSGHPAACWIHVCEGHTPVVEESGSYLPEPHEPISDADWKAYCERYDQEEEDDADEP